MSLTNLLKVGAVALPKVEQAAAWMIGQGPIIENPALPIWVLRTLVQQNRVARLRRGVYAVPDAEARLRLSPYAVGEIVEPGSIVSFYAALAFWNLTDQTPKRIGMVSKTRHSPITFGPQQIVFLARPRAIKGMAYHTRKIGGYSVRVATPTQAFIDALSYPPLASTPAELLGILAHGLDTKIVSQRALRQRARADGSLVVARRLGLLLELATGKTDPELLERARSSHAYSTFGELENQTSAHSVPRWYLQLPTAPQRLQSAAGVRTRAATT